MVNIQLEQAKKMFKEVPVPIGDILRKNPPELQCFGFNIADLDVSFRKSQAQMSMYYKNIDNPDEDICRAFKESVMRSPQEILDKIKRNSNVKAIQKGLDELKNTSSEDAAKKVREASEGFQESMDYGRNDEAIKEQKAHEERLKKAEAVQAKIEAKKKAAEHEEL